MMLTLKEKITKWQHKKTFVMQRKIQNELNIVDFWLEKMITEDEEFVEFFPSKYAKKEVIEYIESAELYWVDITSKYVPRDKIYIRVYKPGYKPAPKKEMSFWRSILHYILRQDSNAESNHNAWG